MITTIALILPLGGCLLGGDKPEPALDIPQSYSGGPKNPVVAEAASPPLDWWKKFHSKELTAVIEQARAANLDIAAAIARIVQADAQSRIAGSALLPVVDLNGSAQRSRNSQSLNTGTTSGLVSGSSGPSERNNFSASLTASYEIDFWGKNRSALRAAEETAVASRYDRDVVGLTTVVATANAYFQVLAAQDRLGVAHDNLSSATRVLNLIQQRLDAGTASALEVAEQQSVVNTQKASIPPLEQTLKQNKNALALLIARSPEHVAIRGGSLRSITYPRVTPGLPSELLAQRPDIREAEAKLASADANVENARAQMLPSITLTGEGGHCCGRSRRSTPPRPA
jgi:NodT family efflux transporter outer membrane factor (OMF) lipoprotein